MQATFQFGRKNTLLFFSGVLFCGLLIAFAVTSKVAAYYPKDIAARPISATKVWQQQDARVVIAPLAQAAAPAIFAFIFAFAVLAAMARSTAWLQTAADVPSAFQLCNRRAHAIRPPPLS
ncbi:MAG TPA: hypothetical protein VGB94_09985 [Acidobacteriaceae bacterium]